MDLLLGIDVGTTSAKAALFDLEGHEIATASHAYGLYSPRPGWVEQNAEELWDGVVAVSRELLRRPGCESQQCWFDDNRFW